MKKSEELAAELDEFLSNLQKFFTSSFLFLQGRGRGEGGTRLQDYLFQ